MKKYILTDGKGNYIRYDRQQKRHVQVNWMNQADSFDSFEKAERVRKCSIGKSLKHKYYTVTIEVKNEEQAHTVREMNMAAGNANVDSDQSNENDPIIAFMEFAKAMLLRKDELSEKRSNVDKEITDLQHYIEQRNLNACDGYKAYKQLQGILIRRRAIKDEQLIVSIIEDCKMEPKSIEDTIKRIHGMDDRKYRPRVLTELFEGCCERG